MLLLYVLQILNYQCITSNSIIITTAVVLLSLNYRIVNSYIIYTPRINIQ
jgi:hypothetical protein